MSELRNTRQQESESAYRAIFESAPVALWDEDFSEVKLILDELIDSGVSDLAAHLREHPEAVSLCVQKVRVRRVNRVARDFYGAQNEEQLIRELPRLFDDQALDIFRDEIIAFASGASTYQAEFSVFTLSGEPRQVLMNVSLVGKQWSRVVVAFTDITERRRLERSLQRANETLRRLNEHLEQFAYAAAHDMREPLRTIGLYTQLLQRNQNPEPGTPSDIALKHILTHACRMETLVSDLLAFTRAVEPKICDPEPCETDAHAVVREVLSDLSKAVQDSSAEIEIAPNLPVIHVQHSHLRQLIQNLLTNAIKYRSSQRRLKIQITSVTTAGETTFCVADNGIGIKPEYQEQIFGIFKRLHGYDIEGNGIGLAVCKKIVEDYGGGIWVESQPNNGARFYFTVPGGRSHHTL